MCVCLCIFLSNVVVVRNIQRTGLDPSNKNLKKEREAANWADSSSRSGSKMNIERRITAHKFHAQNS